MSTDTPIRIVKFSTRAKQRMLAAMGKPEPVEDLLPPRTPKPDKPVEQWKPPVYHPVVRVLEKARAKIDRGWCQGAAHYGNSVCAENALVRAMHENGERERIFLTAKALVLTAAERRTGRPWRSIPAWNDYHHTTKRQVLAVFDAAIEKAKTL